MSTLVRRNVEEGILELRLNRPDRLNALTASLTVNCCKPQWQPW